jgi:hypothetical protein
MLMKMKWLRFTLPGHLKEDRNAGLFYSREINYLLIMIKHSIYRGLVAAVCLMPVSNVMSEGASFDYLEIDYISSTIDLGASIDEVEGDGIGLALSLSFNPAFAMRLAVAATTFDTFQGIGVDTAKITELGVTTHTSVASGTDLYGNLSIVKAEITATDGVASTSDNDFGGKIRIGVRQRLIDALEIDLYASHMEVFNNAVNAYAIDSRFYVRKRVSVGLGYAASNDVYSLLLSVRVDV